MKKFENPKMEVSAFDIFDIITASTDEEEWGGNKGENDTTWN